MAPLPMNMFGIGLGRVQLDDQRDVNYILSDHFPIVAQAYKGVDRKVGDKPPFVVQCRVPAVQNHQPHSVAYAWTNWLRCSPLATLLAPAPEIIYSMCKAIDNLPRNTPGTTIRAGAEVIQSLGFLEHYYWTFSALELRHWLINVGTPVVVGSRWYTRMSAKGGKLCQPDGIYEGEHAYVVSGWRDSEFGGSFTVLNSMAEWGYSSRKYLRYDDLDYLLTTGAEICVPTGKAIGADARRRVSYHATRAIHTPVPQPVAPVELPRKRRLEHVKLTPRDKAALLALDPAADPMRLLAPDDLILPQLPPKKKD